jgi:hypothetical protein
MKIVINTCFGGFSLSDAAYEKLNEWGIPVRQYIKETRNPKTGLYDIKIPENEGEIIFDNELTAEGEDKDHDMMYYEYKGKSRFTQRYWETWIDDKRDHPLLIKVVEELGDKANGPCAELKVVEIPDGIKWEIDEYDGNESIHEVHRSWS